MTTVSNSSMLLQVLILSFCLLAVMKCGYSIDRSIDLDVIYFARTGDGSYRRLDPDVPYFQVYVMVLVEDQIPMFPRKPGKHACVYCISKFMCTHRRT